MKVAIVTLGCKLNWFESQALTERFRGTGFEVVPDADDSDVVVVNTCTVTDRADSKSAYVMRRAKKAGKTVVATGCYATTDAGEIEHLAWADLVVKNSEKLSIPELLNKPESVPLPAASGDFPLVTRFERTRAFLKVQDGCNHFCSYCKIPQARGRSRSLDPATVVSQASVLVGEGYKELVITGVNISDYRHGADTLASLVGRILELPGDFRVRLSSLQPDEFEEGLVGHLSHPKFAPHFHLSLQSGSRFVLQRMHRPYSPEDFLGLVAKIRSAKPDCGITTDIIAGFPQETDEEHLETEEMVRKARFTRVHLFPYSARKHTLADRMPDLPENVKTARVKSLEKIATSTALDFLRETALGKPQRVLSEAKEQGVSNGHSGSYVKCVTSGDWGENAWHDFVPGSIRMVKGIPELHD